MILTRTPYRISFFGGGTDVESFFKENGGSVLSAAIDQYCYVTVRRLYGFFPYRTEVVYSKIERVSCADEIAHPAVRNALKMLDVEDIRLLYDADLPARSGLGSSSSFAVGMLHALHALKGEKVTKRKLADEAIYLERVLCAEHGGWQDQIAAAFGGLNRIDFYESSYDVKPILISPFRKEQLSDHLMMFFTGCTRSSSVIAQINEAKEDRKIFLKEMLPLVDEAESLLCDENVNLDEFGKLLDFEWKLKKETGSAVSTAQIDSLYEKGLKAGALGGKLLGAGGGGFLLFYVPLDKKADVKKALSGLQYVPFQFEEEGTKVVYSSESIPECVRIENKRKGDSK